MARLRRWLINVLIALDQFLGVLVLNGEPDMTISAYAWLWHIKGKRHWPKRLIDRLFWWDRKGNMRHCKQAFESEREGKQLPKECRPKRRGWKIFRFRKKSGKPP